MADKDIYYRAYMTIKAVIFDLDGTITRPYFDFDSIRQQIGLDREAGPLLELMDKMDPEQYRMAETILNYHEQKAVTDSRLNPGARRTLRKLREAGIRIGILTRNRRTNAIAIEKKHGLKFDAIVGREDGPVKPDAFGVLHLCRLFGVEPRQSMVVGDYLFDLQCAKAGGALAVLLNNDGKGQQFAEHADFCIENISQILQIIEQNRQRTD
ncbi:MAG: HAD family hydrolase [Phycisphaerales bacterium]|nr:MAG: HAD family hydrolase [Phycisphaerales bacterium]